MRDSLISSFTSLFEDAREVSPIDYVFTLVRVEGITSHRDPLRELEDVLNRAPTLDRKTYCSLLPIAEAVLGVVENLCRLIRKDPFDLSPLQEHLPAAVLRKSDDQPVELAQIAEVVSGHLDELGRSEIAEAIREAFPAAAAEQCRQAAPGAGSEATPFEACLSLLRAFLRTFLDALAAFKTQPSLYRLPNFQVLELLLDDRGLSGFRLHFSSGSSALFERREHSTNVINILLGVPLEFMVGMHDELKEEWRVGSRLLHEIGLPGRYNPFGMWQPLVFPGDTGQLLAKVKELSDDEDVQGALVYLYCTGHRVLEFVAHMEVELPARTMTAGGRIHLYNCYPSSDSEPMPTSFVYDGWVDLPDATPTIVAAALRDVSRLMNRTGLALDSPVTWRPKYSLRPQRGTRWLGDDIGELNQLLAIYPTGPDGEAIDVAVDWYNRGAASDNPFTSFLCYYIAIEGLTHAIFDGGASFGLDLAPDSTTAGSSNAERISQLHDELYTSDPEEFIRRGYFDVIVGATERTRRLVTAVFGTGSRQYELLFAKRDGSSLTDLRGRLAHGLASELTPSEARTIRQRVGEVRLICRDLILRLLLGLSPDDNLPGTRRGVGMSFQDPRSIQFVSSLAMLQERDWSIRPEWVSWT